jgi:hypothetical protein
MTGICQFAIICVREKDLTWIKNLLIEDRHMTESTTEIVRYRLVNGMEDKAYL